MVLLMNTLKPVLFAVLLAVTAAELEREAPGGGEEKKTKASGLLFEAVDPWLPDWANPVIKAGASFLIDSMVALANRTGFFARLDVS